jgi:hypothetical protein
MPGVVNKYFRLPASAPTVAFMTFTPAGFALGVFRRPAAGPGAGGPPGAAGGGVFTGLVRGDRVRDVSALGTVNDLLADWDNSLGRLAALAADDKGGTGEPGVPGGWADLAALDVRCPVEPRQILQVGANYRKHVGWELELAAVIGKPARNLTRENASSRAAPENRPGSRRRDRGRAHRRTRPERRAASARSGSA